jgi:hypothetical protein
MSLLMIAFLIVNIILAALDIGLCVPRFHDSDNNNSFNNNNNNNGGNGQIDDFGNFFNGGNDVVHDRWCGSKLVVFITHGILIALLIPYFLLNILASREEREWEKGVHTPRKTDTTATTTRPYGAQH